MKTESKSGYAEALAWIMTVVVLSGLATLIGGQAENVDKVQPVLMCEAN